MAGALLRPHAPRFADWGPRFFNIQTVKLSNVATYFRSIPFIFKFLRTLLCNGRLTTLSMSITSALFSARRRVYPSLEPRLPIPYSLPFHSLVHSVALFCTQQKLNPFIFSRFCTLCQKQGGVGRGLLLTSGLSSQSTRSLGGIPGSVSTNSALTAAGACPDRVPLLLSSDHGRLTVAHYFPSRTLLPTDNCPLITAARSSAACCIIPRLSAPERIFG